MKINQFFAAAMSAALIFSACSKEDGANNPAKLPTQASISVKFDLDGGSRAFDNISTDNQDFVNIKNANVFLIEGATGKIAGSKFIDASSTPNLTTLKDTGVDFTGAGITTAIKEVFVVTNTGDITGSKTNKSDVYDVVKTLAELETAYGSSLIWSYGGTTIEGWTQTVTSSEGVNTYTSSAEVKIENVNPILSRVDFTVKFDAGSTGWIGVSGDYASIPAAQTAKKSYVVMKGVAVLYSANNTHYIPAFAPAVAKLGSADPLVSGLIPTTGTQWYDTPRATSVQYKVAETNSFLYGKWDTPNVASNEFTKSFYCLAPNDVYDGIPGKAKPIVTVYAERYLYDTDLDDGTYKEVEHIYWPIHFDGATKYVADKTLTMDNGQRYAIAVTLKGDLSDPGTHNIKDPEKKYLADVNVVVSEAKWKAVISAEAVFGE